MINLSGRVISPGFASQPQWTWLQYACFLVICHNPMLFYAQALESWIANGGLPVNVKVGAPALMISSQHHIQTQKVSKCKNSCQY